MAKTKNIEYRLKSNPDAIIHIPEEYASRAEKVMKELDDITSRRQLGYFISAHFYPIYEDAAEDAKDIFSLKSRNLEGNNIELFKMEDKLYLKLCIKKARSSLQASRHLAERGKTDAAEKIAEQEDTIKSLTSIINALTSPKK